MLQPPHTFAEVTFPFPPHLRDHLPGLRVVLIFFLFQRVIVFFKVKLEIKYSGADRVFSASGTSGPEFLLI